MTTLKERFEKEFCFVSRDEHQMLCLHEGIDPISIISFFQKELLDIASMVEELQGDETYPELKLANVSLRAATALIRSKANELL